MARIMTAKNDVTGADLVTKAATDLYREGHERIFGKKQKVTAPYVDRLPRTGSASVSACGCHRYSSDGGACCHEHRCDKHAAPAAPDGGGNA
jgi:hypothetical protein